MALPDGVEVRGPAREKYPAILSDEALALVAELQRELGPTRSDLLARRAERQAAFDAGELPDFLPATASVREGDWRVAPVEGLSDRRVEITGPTDRKMLINALNSGARVFMADFEDANAPTWENMFGGQQNLVDAIEGTISFESPDGRQYRLGEETATLMPRPRGWHLPEKHVVVDGQPASGSLVDFGLFLFNGGRRLLEQGQGVYLYLPKLESHLEARLWNDAFQLASDRLGVPRGTVKATVLIETITAAFEMDEILYELRDHSTGLNAGRWDYMFSVIKKFRNRPEFTLPDRNKVTMTVPFMRAYTQLLVKTCHRRGAFAMGGMSAFIPSRRRPEINEQAFAKVREDKQREAGDGFDGTWVAHPDLVPVAREVFDEVLGDRPNQIDRQRDDVQVGQDDLLDIASTPGEATEEGLRNNVNVGIQYISSWLRGQGAAPIFNLMEDAATAEISRSQVWQWVHNGVKLAEGQTVTADLVRQTETEELDKIRRQVGDEFFYNEGRPDQSRALFEQVALADDFIEFLTIPAYEQLD
ncbi:MAG TPA: malate synthase A [Actinomycetes bacterium]|jgi:malate synthase|nr:malate synthase A [Actinomycetes bacterium]